MAFCQYNINFLALTAYFLTVHVYAGERAGTRLTVETPCSSHLAVGTSFLQGSSTMEGTGVTYTPTYELSQCGRPRVNISLNLAFWGRGTKGRKKTDGCFLSWDFQGHLSQGTKHEPRCMRPFVFPLFPRSTFTNRPEPCWALSKMQFPPSRDSPGHEGRVDASEKEDIWLKIAVYSV